MQGKFSIDLWVLLDVAAQTLESGAQHTQLVSTSPGRILQQLFFQLGCWL